MDNIILEDTAVSLLENEIVDELEDAIDDVLANDSGDIDAIAMISDEDVENYDYDPEEEAEAMGISNIDDFDNDAAGAYASESDDVIYEIEDDGDDDIAALQAAIEDEDLED